MERGDTTSITEEMNYYRSMIDSTERQIANLERLAQEINTTISVVGDPDLFESEDKKITIGSGIFMSAKIEKPDKLIVPIGADVYIEESPEKVQERLKSNMAQLSTSLESLYARRKDLTNRYESLLMILQRVSAQQEEKGKNA